MIVKLLVLKGLLNQRDLKNNGVTVLFISHKLDEVLEIADEISVMRSGQMSDTVLNDNVSKTQLAEMMIGKSLPTPPERNTFADEKVIVEGDGEVVYNGNLKMRVAGDFDLEVGGDFNVTKFALGDDEIDYALWDTTHTQGTDYYGAVIDNLPALEPFNDPSEIMKYKLVTRSPGTGAMEKIIDG